MKKRIIALLLIGALVLGAGPLYAFSAQAAEAPAAEPVAEEPQAEAIQPIAAAAIQPIAAGSFDYQIYASNTGNPNVTGSGADGQSAPTTFAHAIEVACTAVNASYNVVIYVMNDCYADVTEWSSWQEHAIDSGRNITIAPAPGVQKVTVKPTGADGTGATGYKDGCFLLIQGGGTLTLQRGITFDGILTDEQSNNQGGRGIPFWVKSGSLILEGATITNFFIRATETNNGAIYADNVNSVVTLLDGSVITGNDNSSGNKSGQRAGGICMQAGVLNLSGNVTIANNTLDRTTRGNVNMGNGTSATISLEGKVTGKIGVTINGGPGTVIARGNWQRPGEAADSQDSFFDDNVTYAPAVLTATGSNIIWQTAYWVSSSGLDSNQGSRGYPKKTVVDALRAAEGDDNRNPNPSTANGATVYLMNGVDFGSSSDYIFPGTQTAGIGPINIRPDPIDNSQPAKATINGVPTSGHLLNFSNWLRIIGVEFNGGNRSADGFIWIGNGGTLTIGNGATITNFNANNALIGGGNGSVYLSGGKVTGNTVTNAGAIAVGNSLNLYVSGAAEVSNNTTNVVLHNGQAINVDTAGLTAGAKIGVYTPGGSTNGTVIAKAGSTTMAAAAARYFFDDWGSKVAVHHGGTSNIVWAGTYYVGNNSNANPTGTKDNPYPTVMAALEAMGRDTDIYTGGDAVMYVMENVAFGNQKLSGSLGATDLTVQNPTNTWGTVTITSDPGRQDTTTNPVVNVGVTDTGHLLNFDNTFEFSNITFDLTDCTSNGFAWMSNGGNLILDQGTEIINFTGRDAFIGFGGNNSGSNEITISGGKITNIDVGTADLIQLGNTKANNAVSFTMSDGEISGNTAGNLIKINNNSSTNITLTGGTISDNTVSDTGYAINTDTSGIVSLSGNVTVKDNTTTSGAQHNIGVGSRNDAIVLAKKLIGTVGVYQNNAARGIQFGQYTDVGVDNGVNNLVSDLHSEQRGQVYGADKNLIWTNQVARIVTSDGTATVDSGYYTLSAALADYYNSQNSSTQYIQLTDYVQEDTLAISSDLYLDLNGNDIKSAIAFIGGTLYGMDSATNDYGAGSKSYGKITGTVIEASFGEIAPYTETKDEHYTTGVTGQRVSGMKYLCVKDENGAYSFHRFNLQIDGFDFYFSPNTGDGTISATMAFQGDSTVIDQLEAVGGSVVIPGDSSGPLTAMLSKDESTGYNGIIECQGRSPYFYEVDLDGLGEYNVDMQGDVLNGLTADFTFSGYLELTHYKGSDNITLETVHYEVSFLDLMYRYYTSNDASLEMKKAIEDFRSANPSLEDSWNESLGWETA